MKLIVNAPKKSLSKSFLKQRPLRSEINVFKEKLITLLNKVDEIDHMVYELFGLTEEEIAIIENGK